MITETSLPTPTAQEPSSTRLVLTLALAGFLSGIAIVGIYEATLETILANKAAELRAAVFKVLPGVSKMQKLAYSDGELRRATGDDDPEAVIYGGYGETGEFIGYAIPGSGPGFQDTIGLLFGYQSVKRRVVGMEVLESRETPGLGDKIYKDAAFVANFSALSIEPEIVTVKKGTRSAPNEVDAITGATISSKAVVRIINTALKQWLPQLPESGAEPVFVPEPVETQKVAE